MGWVLLWALCPLILALFPHVCNDNCDVLRRMGIISYSSPRFAPNASATWGGNRCLYAPRAVLQALRICFGKTGCPHGFNANETDSAGARNTTLSSQFASLGLRGGTFLTCLFLLSLPLCSEGRSPGAPEKVSQAQINELAASLERVHRTLIEEPGIRRPGESFPLYIRRLAAPLPGEPSGRYVARIEGYLRSFDRATQETALGRRMPSLQENSAANRALWQRAVSSLSYLPGRMVKIHAVWRKLRKAGDTKNLPTADLGTEIAQTLDLAITALDALRDATP